MNKKIPCIFLEIAYHSIYLLNIKNHERFREYRVCKHLGSTKHPIITRRKRDRERQREREKERERERGRGGGDL